MPELSARTSRDDAITTTSASSDKVTAVDDRKSDARRARGIDAGRACLPVIAAMRATASFIANDSSAFIPGPGPRIDAHPVPTGTRSCGCSQ